MTAATEKLLTPENCAFIFIDHQPQMAFGVTSIDHQLLKNNVIAMARTARLFNVPTVLTAMETQSFSGHIWPELTDVLRQDPIECSSLNAWEDPVFVEAVKKTGRKKLVMAALWTEACLLFPAICARAEGFEVIMNIDASGGTSPEAHNAAVRRMEQHGVESITTVQLLLELQRGLKLQRGLDMQRGLELQQGAALQQGREQQQRPAPRASRAKYGKNRARILRCLRQTRRMRCLHSPLLRTASAISA